MGLGMRNGGQEIIEMMKGYQILDFCCVVGYYYILDFGRGGYMDIDNCRYIYLEWYSFI